MLLMPLLTWVTYRGSWIEKKKRDNQVFPVVTTLDFVVGYGVKHVESKCFPSLSWGAQQGNGENSDVRSLGCSWGTV